MPRYATINIELPSDMVAHIVIRARHQIEAPKTKAVKLKHKT